MGYTPGQKVGDYEIIEPLGAGGMGEVYKVRNAISDRVEAMKVLLPDLAGQQELAGRFLREIKVLASLDHPNIASLRTAQHVGNQLIMIMELVEGTTLAHRLRGGPLPEREAVDFTIQVLSALSYAHARGIIHRDIKPANMMLMPNGVIKLMDFGIASAAGESKLTQTGSTLGSIYYMSPEQVQAHALDARSDLYSLGVSLYEMVTGLHPFEGDTGYSIMKGHIDGTFIAPRQVNPNISSALNAVVLRGMARQPDQRYQTADEFSAALEHLKQTEQTSVAGVAPAASDATVPSRRAVTPVSSSDPTLISPPQPPVVVAAAMASPPRVTAPPSPAPVIASAVSAAPPHVPSSKRALYMVLGSALTLLVIVLTAMRLPVFHGQASDSTSVAPAPANATPPPSPATSIPAAPAVDAATPPSAAAAAPTPAPTPAATSVAPGTSPAPSAATGAAVAASSPAAPPPATSVARPRGNRPEPPAANRPAGAAGVTRTDEAARPAPAPQAATGGAAALLDEQETRLVQLNARYTAIRTSYERLKREQAASGYSPDPSLTVAVVTGDQYLGRADAAIAAHDGAAAKKYLDLAEPQVVIIEKVFGR